MPPVKRKRPANSQDGEVKSRRMEGQDSVGARQIEQAHGNHAAQDEMLAQAAPVDANRLFEQIMANLARGESGADSAADQLPIALGSDKSDACWSGALHGSGGDDPAPEFYEAAVDKDSPFKLGGDMVVRPRRGASRKKQGAWHREQAERAIQGAGLRLSGGSELQVAYQYVEKTAMYHHWELKRGDLRIAKFPGVYTHAKQTKTDEPDIVEELIGIDPASLKPAHIDVLGELADPKGPTEAHGDIYGTE